MSDTGSTPLFDLIAAAIAENDSDILLINSGMSNGLDTTLREKIDEKSTLRDKVIVILVTSGGLADTAYRCARLLQSTYNHVTVCVSGWCKSAGTLLAIGAHDLIIGERGELGPLDVQLTKRDELFDRDSGLISNASLDRLREESFQFFESFMLKIISKSQNAVTFRTAADVAAEVTIGLMAPIFEKIDPLRLGADARAMQIGYAYAVRLNVETENIRNADALNMLLNGYPSHSFVIDYDEADVLFTRVKRLDGSLAAVVDSLGALTLTPRDEPFVCFLEGSSDGNRDGDAEAEPNQGGTPAEKGDPGPVDGNDEESANLAGPDHEGDVGPDGTDGAS